MSPSTRGREREVAGIVRPAGASGQILRAFRKGRFAHVTSSAILDEMVNVLTRAKLQRIAHPSLEEIGQPACGRPWQQHGKTWR